MLPCSLSVMLMNAEFELVVVLFVGVGFVNVIVGGVVSIVMVLVSVVFVFPAVSLAVALNVFVPLVNVNVKFVWLVPVV